MTLSDIKFNYQEKIDNVNARIRRYQEIICDYNGKIKRAEQEDNPNISSVVKSKEQYEHKIQNMECVKAHYQEFVDTADYLLQNLNKNSNTLSNLKYEQLEKRNTELYDELDILETKNYEQKNEFEKMELKYEDKIEELKIKLETKDDIIKRKKIQIKQLRNKSVKDTPNSSKTKKGLLFENKKLVNEIVSLKDTNDFLETKNEMLGRKVEQLEDYCNHLLNRKENEMVSPVSEDNIFKQLVGGNKYPHTIF